MRNILKYASVLALFVSTMAGCNKEPDRYDPQSPVDQMRVTASVDDIALVKEDADEPAVTFKWDAAYDHGSEYTLRYYIRLRHGDMPGVFATDTVRVDNQTREITYSVGEVNETLAKWGVFPGDRIPVQAQVIAISSEGPKFQMPEFSTVTFTASGYDVANYLSMVIDRGGVETVVPLSEEIVSTDQFLWAGSTIKVGDKIRFIRSAVDGTWPAYVRDGVDGLKLADSAAEGAAAEYEIVAWPGYQLPTNNDQYIVKVDMKNLRFSVASGALMCAVGGATDVAWSNGDAVTRYAFKQPDPMNRPGIWTLTGNFRDGGAGDSRAFKILLENGWSKGFWAATSGADPFVVQPLTQNNDNKWYMPDGASGTYTVTVNLVDMTLIMNKN